MSQSVANRCCLTHKQPNWDNDKSVAERVLRCSYLPLIPLLFVAGISLYLLEKHFATKVNIKSSSGWLLYSKCNMVFGWSDRDFLSFLFYNTAEEQIHKCINHLLLLYMLNVINKLRFDTWKWRYNIILSIVICLH